MAVHRRWLELNPWGGEIKYCHVFAAHIISCGLHVMNKNKNDDDDNDNDDIISSQYAHNDTVNELTDAIAVCTQLQREFLAQKLVQSDCAVVSKGGGEMWDPQE